jgi:transcriptional regulator with XRE-family HTH domain
MIALGKVLKLIDDTGIVDYKIERDIGLKRASISNWRRELANPSVDALVKIADYFGVSLDYLVGRDHDVTRESEIKFTTALPLDIADMWQKLNPQQQSEIRGEMRGYTKANNKSEIEKAFEEGEMRGRQTQTRKSKVVKMT